MHTVAYLSYCACPYQQHCCPPPPYSTLCCPHPCGPQDTTGTEPHGFYNLVEFLINDRAGRGIITLEEAMQIMYLR